MFIYLTMIMLSIRLTIRNVKKADIKTDTTDILVLD